MRSTEKRPVKGFDARLDRTADVTLAERGAKRHLALSPIVYHKI
jgi:hypothetical protein